jgi:hypothetical protein
MYYKSVDIEHCGTDYRVFYVRYGFDLEWFVEDIEPMPLAQDVGEITSLASVLVKKLRVLVVCEESQSVTKAFREKGHEAYSCDLKDCTGGHPEWHMKMDCFDAIHDCSWDIIIAHPPCTHLTVAGNRHYAKGKEKHYLRVESARFVQELWDAATSVCDMVALENPVGCISTMCEMPKPNYIQPYEYGHNARKKTGLWLHGLPPLKPTEIVEPELIEYTRSNGKKTTFSADYMKGVDRSGKMKASGKRSKTYAGVARAMADQWG